MDDLPGGLDAGMLRSLAANLDVHESLRQEMESVGTSPAGLLADIVNVMRADVVQIAEVHGVDVDVQVMSEERAARVLGDLIEGEPTLIEIFNEVARKRQKVILDILDEHPELAERYIEKKTQVMNSAEPETWDGGD